MVVVVLDMPEYPLIFARASATLFASASEVKSTLIAQLSRPFPSLVVVSTANLIAPVVKSL